MSDWGTFCITQSCKKCVTGTVSKNQDGDYFCLMCGVVYYATIPLDRQKVIYKYSHGGKHA